MSKIIKDFLKNHKVLTLILASFIILGLSKLMGGSTSEAEATVIGRNVVVKSASTLPEVKAENINLSNSVVTQQGVTTASSLTVRSGAGANYSCVGSMKKGTNVTLQGKINNFYKITYGGKTRYIGVQYVKIIDPYSRSIPVLAYHSITYSKGNSICLPLVNFKEQMKYLKDNGYHTITLSDLYKYRTRQKTLPEKSVVLTFDDGYKNNYIDMFPVLKKYNFKATIFVISSFVDKNSKFLTSKQLVEMDKYGIEIDAHTVKHENLITLSKDKQLQTVTQSKKDIEKILNKKINFFSYPYGGYNKSAIEVVKKAGYTMAVTTDAGWESKNNNVLILPRVDISSSRYMNSFKSRVSNPNYKSLGL